MSNEQLTKPNKPTPETVESASCATRLPVWTPRTDVYQTEDAMVMIMDMPGVPADKLDIELENNSLRISGDAVVPLTEGMDWLRREVRNRRYSRTFQLGNRVNTEKLNARLKNGVLTVNIPFKTETMARKIEISG